MEFREILIATRIHIFAAGEDGKQKDATVLVAEQGLSKEKMLLSDARSKHEPIIFGGSAAIETSATRMCPVIIEKSEAGSGHLPQRILQTDPGIVHCRGRSWSCKSANDLWHGLSYVFFTKHLTREIQRCWVVQVQINGPSLHD
jgi:hypothetical protein